MPWMKWNEMREILEAWEIPKFLKKWLTLDGMSNWLLNTESWISHQIIGRKIQNKKVSCTTSHYNYTTSIFFDFTWMYLYF